MTIEPEDLLKVQTFIINDIRRILNFTLISKEVDLATSMENNDTFENMETELVHQIREAFKKWMQKNMELVDPPPQHMENLQLFLVSLKWFSSNSKIFLFFPLKGPKTHIKISI